MRRIFGGSNASSSASTQGATEPLQSPVGSTSSSAAGPSSSGAQSFDARYQAAPTRPLYSDHNGSSTQSGIESFLSATSSSGRVEPTRQSFQHEHEYSAATGGPQQRQYNSPYSAADESKGEDYSAGNSHARQVVAASNAKQSDVGYGHPQTLPTSHARTLSTSSASRNVSSTMNASYQSNSLSAGLRARSPMSSGGGSDGSAAGAGKDAIMIELLSGQAELEAKDFEILEWEEMQALKKEHAQLSSKIASLTRSLALENRLKDSAAKLVRLSGPSNESSPAATSTAASKSRVTREQAEQQVATATAKIDAISADMYKVGWKESELRTRLLRHTAGVLALALKRREDEERAWSSHTPIQSSSAAFSPNGFGTFSSPFNSVHSRQVSDRFEGPHLYAGNKDAFVPTGRPAGSPLGSPALVGGGFARAQDEARIVELETQVEDLKRAVEAAKRENEEALASHKATRSDDQSRLQQVEDELDQTREQHDATKSEAATHRRLADDAKLELEQMRYEIEDVREQLRQSQESADLASQELERTRQSGLANDQVEQQLDEARRLAQEASERAQHAEMELAQTEHRTVEAERRVDELEEELERARLADGQASRDVDRVSVPEGGSRDEVAALLAERTKISHAIGDVLRRHRRGSPLGSALREVPPFDDEADHADLPSYLASAVDSHFEQAATQFEALSMASAGAVTEDLHNSLQEQLHALSAERDHLQLELEQTRLERDNLESSHADLEHRLGEHAHHLEGLDGVQRDLDIARDAERQLKVDLDDTTARVAQLEGQLEEQEQILRDLWSVVPSRTSTSTSESLATLKAAFTSSDVSSEAFSLVGLVQRIRNLIAQDASLIERLTEFDADAKKRGIDADKALQVSQETQANLEAAKKQLVELEERVAVSSEKEASMLERLNDLTQNLEQVRQEKRALQSRIEATEADKAKLSEQFSAAQAEIARQQDRPAEDSVKSRELENQVQDLRDEIQDLQEELEEAKGRESKTRAQLLEELNMLSTQATPPHLLPSKATATPDDYLVHDFELPERRYPSAGDPLLVELVTKVIRCDKRQREADTASAPKAKAKNKSSGTATRVSKSEIWEIELEDTVLFPEGGGQPCDHGSITPKVGDKFDEAQAVSVTDVQRRNLDAIHFASGPIDVGTEVLVKIDTERRQDLMCQHTGQHLLSAILERQFGLDTVAWSLTKAPELCYIELPKAPSAEDLARVQELCNQAIQAGHRLQVKMQLAGQDGVELGEKVPTDYIDANGSTDRRPVMRTVAIGKIDENPCCGTHFPSLSFLQSLFISPVTTVIRGTNARVYFCVGPRVLRQLSLGQHILRQATTDLGCAQNELADRISTLKVTATESLRAVKKLRDELAVLLAEQLWTDSEPQSSAQLRYGILFKEEDATNNLEFLSAVSTALRTRLESLSKEGQCLLMLASAGTPGNPSSAPGSLIIVGSDSLVAKAGQLVVQKFQGRIKGGGRGRWQGKMTEKWLKGDELMLKSILEETIA
ncbi:hypothetical protein OIV83_003116 [Microbotryomycetes sp. JL201]|nr:hypothetical protein OIV83_003116 [Microbotryomycetes sp. JL201]